MESRTKITALAGIALVATATFAAPAAAMAAPTASPFDNVVVGGDDAAQCTSTIVGNTENIDCNKIDIGPLDRLDVQVPNNHYAVTVTNDTNNGQNVWAHTHANHATVQPNGSATFYSAQVFKNWAWMVHLHTMAKTNTSPANNVHISITYTP